jgi:Protein of unknown function (DUF1329)
MEIDFTRRRAGSPTPATGADRMRHPRIGEAVMLAVALFLIPALAAAQTFHMRRVRMPKNLPPALRQSLMDQVTNDVSPYLNREDSRKAAGEAYTDLQQRFEYLPNRGRGGRLIVSVKLGGAEYNPKGAAGGKGSATGRLRYLVFTYARSGNKWVQIAKPKWETQSLGKAAAAQMTRRRSLAEKQNAAAEAAQEEREERAALEAALKAEPAPAPATAAAPAQRAGNPPAPASSSPPARPNAGAPSGPAGASSIASDTIPAGTHITMANWQQYRRFMPDGMVALFEGKYFWKMPPDVDMVVGPPPAEAAGGGYLDATEQYGGQTQAVVLPNGHHDLKNYVAGMPFPNPAAPHKGWKILADSWFGPTPRISAATPETGLASLCTLDRSGNTTCLKVSYVNRQLAHITEPGYPRTDPEANGAYFTEWSMIEQPERLRYTAALTIFYQDLQRAPDDYVFLPALGRSMRLATGARCATAFGSDFTKDDNRAGFNGSIAIFQAKYLRDQKILALDDITGADGNFPREYDMPLGWPKPSWGKWSLHDVWVIDVRRIPSAAQGYCYGKRIMYVDKYSLHESWTDLYDSNMKLWKVLLVGAATRRIGGQASPVLGSLIEQMWDLQNDHATFFFTADGHGHDIVVDQAVPRQYRDVARYCTPSGLTRVMR